MFFSLYYYDEEVEDEDIEDYEQRKQMPILSLLAICPSQKETPCTAHLRAVGKIHLGWLRNPAPVGITEKL